MNLTKVKKVLIGEPFPNSREMHERLDKVRALAIFASDPISSNAYATEAIMSVLLVLGSGALQLTLPIGLAVAGLVLLVVTSYIQTIFHYPDGGGAYTVAKDNLGNFPSLLAAAALLTDYILTVSVSVSAGVRAVTSAFPGAYEHRIGIALGAIFFITWINLRGVRESGTVFAIPTYAFVVGVLAMVALGLVRYFGLFNAAPIEVVTHTVAAQGSYEGFAYVWLLLRAFAGGCTALTGIEAISNGVNSFKAPEAKNAVLTMIMMAVFAMSLFLGITFLGTRLNLVPHEAESILSQLSRQVTNGGFLYYWIQVFTALILFLAANTGYQGFPQLSSFLANDNYLPRWLQNRGDRLVYSAGIIVLTVISSIIVVIFKADEISMLPLYAIGVMLSFTISQSGMFKLMGRISHLKPGEHIKTSVTEIHYEKNVFWKRMLNAIGAIVTFVVLIILIVTKFVEGAWIIVVFIPILMAIFYSINNHYNNMANALSTRNLESGEIRGIANVVIVPVADIHRGSLLALEYSKLISSDVRAVSIAISEEKKKRFMERWNRFSDITTGVKLDIIDYEYRNIIPPLVEYIEEVNNKEFPEQVTTVVIPEFLPEHGYEEMLHNQTAKRLRSQLKQYKDLVIIEVPYHIDSKI